MGIVFLSQFPSRWGESPTSIMFSVLSIATGSYVVLVELFILGIYLKYLLVCKREESVDVFRLIILSGYGILSCLVLMVLEVMMAIAGNLQGASLEVAIACISGQFICPLLYTYIQLGMKLAL
ncbi:hypothetical protein BCR33DRAFT_716175, partial [Rhizoclosmatium globosum]